jgi:hypothetical protein
VTHPLKFFLLPALIYISLVSASLAEESSQHHEYPKSGSDLDCEVGFDSLKSVILAIDGIQPAGNNHEFESYAALSDHSIYVFTKQGHYAHPMIIKRKVTQDNGAIVVVITGCGYNSKRNSDRLMKEFRNLNEQLSDDIRGQD